MGVMGALWAIYFQYQLIPKALPVHAYLNSRHCFDHSNAKFLASKCIHGVQTT